MSDLFHEEIPDNYIRQMFDVIRRAPQHTFQVLTKRAEASPVIDGPIRAGEMDMAADSDKTMIRVIGLILLVGGIGFAYWGYQMSQSFASNITRAVTGALPDGVMYRYIGGAISGVAGLFLLVKK